jgi:hypothetical protein
VFLIRGGSSVMLDGSHETAEHAVRLYFVGAMESIESDCDLYMVMEGGLGARFTRAAGRRIRMRGMNCRCR